MGMIWEITCDMLSVPVCEDEVKLERGDMGLCPVAAWWCLWGDRKNWGIIYWSKKEFKSCIERERTLAKIALLFSAFRS